MEQEEHKYRYMLDGTLYFIFLNAEDKLLFESRYGVFLSQTD